MKATVQSSKSMSSSSASSKSKKNSKDREKRKSQTGAAENNSNDKGSPAKDFKQYAGISSESLRIYTEQSTYEHLSKKVCNILTEDINYKLRYIIHDALLKARLSGRDAINSGDIDETFKDLSIEKVYGATASPNWIPFGDQNLLYLDDTKINLIELAEEENTYVQEGNAVLIKNWYPDPELQQPCEALKDYFTTLCRSVISNDEELRRVALKDISENPQIGPIMEWFYHFGYFLLMKDITYDCLTLSALDLIETLENSPLSSANVSEKQLKLLVRLLLQRLLTSHKTKDVLKPMSYVLSILCLREPLKEMAIMKLNQKITDEKDETALPILTTIYFLGIDAVCEVFIPNMDYFLNLVVQAQVSDLTYITLGIYGLLCKANCNFNYIHNRFREAFDFLVIYWRPPQGLVKDAQKREINFINMKTKLLRTRRKVDRDIRKRQVKLTLEETSDIPTKTRRKVDCNGRKGQVKFSLEEVFDIPTNDCKLRRKIEEQRKGMKHFKKETHVTIGKTSSSLLLSVLRNERSKLIPNYCDHSLLSYNF